MPSSFTQVQKKFYKDLFNPDSKIILSEVCRKEKQIQELNLYDVGVQRIFHKSIQEEKYDPIRFSLGQELIDFLEGTKLMMLYQDEQTQELILKQRTEYLIQIFKIIYKHCYKPKNADESDQFWEKIAEIITETLKFNFDEEEIIDFYVLERIYLSYVTLNSDRQLDEFKQSVIDSMLLLKGVEHSKLIRNTEKALQQIREEVLEQYQEATQVNFTWSKVLLGISPLAVGLVLGWSVVVTAVTTVTALGAVVYHAIEERKLTTETENKIVEAAKKIYQSEFGTTKNFDAEKIKNNFGYRLMTVKDMHEKLLRTRRLVPVELLDSKKEEHILYRTQDEKLPSFWSLIQPDNQPTRTQQAKMKRARAVVELEEEFLPVTQEEQKDDKITLVGEDKNNSNIEIYHNRTYKNILALLDPEKTYRSMFNEQQRNRTEERPTRPFGQSGIKKIGPNFYWCKDPKTKDRLLFFQVGTVLVQMNNKKKEAPLVELVKRGNKIG